MLRPGLHRGWSATLRPGGSPPLEQVVRELGSQCRRRNWTLIVPEQYGHCSDHALVMISSRPVRRLPPSSACGRPRSALAGTGWPWPPAGGRGLFPPLPSGSGVPLSQDELHRLIHQRSPPSSSPQELCARYFTYMSRGVRGPFRPLRRWGHPRRKLEAAQSLSIRTVLGPWQEIADVTVTLGLYPVERTRTGQVLR